MKKYDNELVYLAKIKSHLSYEVKVNDVSIATRFNPDGGTIWYPINSVILEKGEQLLEVNIFPKNITCETAEDNINLEHGFEITIEETINGNNEAAKVFNYKLSNYDNYSQKNVDFSNLNQYSREFTFNANVPYNLEGWKDSYKFSNNDTINLRGKVFSFYKNLKDDFENQKREQFVQKISKGLYNSCQASYYSDEQFQDQLANKISFINKKPRTLENIDNYKIVLLGKKRLIGLKRIDGCNNEEGVLRRPYKKNGMPMVKIEDILLHMPNGTKDFEVIWYMNYKKGLVK